MEQGQHKVFDLLAVGGLNPVYLIYNSTQASSGTTPTFGSRESFCSPYTWKYRYYSRRLEQIREIRGINRVHGPLWRNASEMVRRALGQ
ncbi:UNVERIFIED_CONTAM: hypothetical protein Slati_0740700 [Sesamum latifolium]|uniref:Uncharacterized protein n=1 Tax=Sesamum latifolium TaxID=2727402 RepID=A0AAW2XIM1_9LAMI